MRAPATGTRGYDVLTLEAFDAAGAPLSLGSRPAVTWDIPTALERRSGCHGDILPACDPSYVVGVRPIIPGDHTVSARFAGHHASVDIARLAP